MAKIKLFSGNLVRNRLDRDDSSPYRQLTLVILERPEMSNLRSDRDPLNRIPILQRRSKGIPVTGCLAVFFRSLLSERALGDAGHRHVAQRVREIAQEVESLDFAALAAGLTHAGTVLMQQCRCVATLGSVVPA